VTQHQRHGETERAHEGFEARLEVVFEWLEDNSKPVLGALAALVLLGAAVAVIFEWSAGQAESAQAQLDAVERDYFEAMGANPFALYVAEPANREQAQRARETALAGYEQVSVDHRGSVADHVAQIRAAEVEVELGELDAAEQRLATAADEMDEDSPLRATALRLRGYALEQLGRFADAAAAYEAAGAIESYPAREGLYAAAGESWLRAGDSARALGAFRETLALAPAWAERQGLVERVAGLEALLEGAAGSS